MILTNSGFWVINPFALSQRQASQKTVTGLPWKMCTVSCISGHLLLWCRFGVALLSFLGNRQIWTKEFVFLRGVRKIAGCVAAAPFSEVQFQWFVSWIDTVQSPDMSRWFLLNLWQCSLAGQSQRGNPGTWVFAHRKKEAHTSKLKASCDGSWKMWLSC